MVHIPWISNKTSLFYFHFLMAREISCQPQLLVDEARKAKRKRNANHLSKKEKNTKVNQMLGKRLAKPLRRGKKWNG